LTATGGAICGGPSWVGFAETDSASPHDHQESIVTRVLLLVVFAVLSTSCAVQVTSGDISRPRHSPATSLARHVTRPPRHSPATSLAPHATLIDDDLVATLKRRNVTVISTLAREEAMSARADDPVYVDRPFFKRGLSAERLVLLKTAKRDEQRNARSRPC
jgi:hypothetical protein